MTTPLPAAAADRAAFPLLRWFSLLSLAAVGVASVVMALVVGRVLESNLLRHDAELSRDFVQGLVTTQGVARDFRTPPQAATSAAFTEFVGHVAGMPDVLRANAYALDGRILWSSQRELIGRMSADNDELRRALGGVLVVERGPVRQHAQGQPLKPEHVALHAHQFVESYIPVHDESRDHSPLVGVIELYRVPRGLNETLDAGALMVWAGALAGGLLLYLSTLGVVRHAARVMRSQRAELVEAEAVVLVGEIAAAAAHNIRNPLASIRSTAELQRELGLLPDAAALDTMRQADRIERQVRVLLDCARGAFDPGARADASQVLEAVAREFAAGAHARCIAIDVQAEAGLPSARIEPELLEQMVGSLLANAVEAMPHGGRVCLRAAREAGGLRIDVSDAGTGIALEHAPRLFEPRFTTKPQGLGMGLALVRRVLTRLGATIEVAGEPGRGTTVTLRMPIEEGWLQ